MADPQRLVGVLLDDEHRHARVVDRGDAGEHLVLHGGGQAGGRLVEQEEAGLHHQRPGHGEHLALPAGEGVGPIPASVPQRGEQVEHVVASSGKAVRAQVHAHAEVLLDVQGAEHVADLGDVADPARHQVVAVDADDVVAVEGHRAGPDRDQAEHGLDQRGLPGSVGSDDADQLGSGDVDRRAPEDVDAGDVAGDEVTDDEERFAGHDRAPSGSVLSGSALSGSVLSA